MRISGSPVNTQIARGSPSGKRLTSVHPPGTSAIWASVFRRCVRATRNATATFSIFRTSRISAAIAHEIRQPLTAMAGAVKELARLVPLEEDEKHLVNIVSRESERLNNI